MVDGGDKVEGAGIRRDEERVLEEKMRELEEFFREFHRRVMDFWHVALKYYVENVLDVFGLMKEFGELWGSVVGPPFFYTELQYSNHLWHGLEDEFAKRVREKPGTYPKSISYHGVFPMNFSGVVCIDFYDAVVLEVGDSLRKKASVIVLNFREARVRRCEGP
jgi:hypothetical protein